MSIKKGVWLLPFLLANTSDTPTAGSSPAHSGAVGDVAEATVGVGKVFQAGQTDGLILYALVLSSFLLFLVSILLAVLVFRYLTKAQVTNAKVVADKDSVNADQTKMFVESMDRTAAAISALSVSVANDLQERAATGAVLARIEGTDQRIIALLEQLRNVR